MSKYEKLRQELERTGQGTMKCFGSSMIPILANPSTCSYVRQELYAKGDIVFSKVRGRYIDAHKITAVGADGRYLISNNHGHDNGWTRTIYGKVVQSIDAQGQAKAH